VFPFKTFEERKVNSTKSLNSNMTPARVSLYIKGMGEILILAQYTHKPTKKLQSSCGELVVVTFSERQNIVKDIELQREELYIERGLMRGLVDHEIGFL